MTETGSFGEISQTKMLNTFSLNYTKRFISFNNGDKAGSPLRDMLRWWNRDWEWTGEMERNLVRGCKIQIDRRNYFWFFMAQ